MKLCFESGVFANKKAKCFQDVVHFCVGVEKNCNRVFVMSPRTHRFLQIYNKCHFSISGHRPHHQMCYFLQR